VGDLGRQQPERLGPSCAGQVLLYLDAALYLPAQVLVGALQLARALGQPPRRARRGGRSSTSKAGNCGNTIFVALYVP